jgi:uracil phosphoribosyltransferase
MITNISLQNSIATHFLNELRDKSIQQDSWRFRKNIERLSEILIYEATKQLDYIGHSVETPLGIKDSVTIADTLVIASIMRAGLPMHYAVLDFIDKAESCFITAYRKHHKSGGFEISLDYIASPRLDDKVLILCDPMIATGASIQATLGQLQAYGTPKKIILLGIIASRQGIDFVQNIDNQIDIFIVDIDEELTAKSYIVPGLGDAGDLAFGNKIDI